MSLENAEEKDMKVEGYIYHYGGIFKIIIANSNIYEVVCQKKEVKCIEKRKENRISEGKKDG